MDGPQRLDDTDIDLVAPGLDIKAELPSMLYGDEDDPITLETRELQLDIVTDEAKMELDLAISPIHVHLT